MTTDFDCIILISTKELNLIKKQISTEIHYFIDKNKERISKSFLHNCVDNIYIYSLIKDILLHLKNYTNLLNHLNINQIREISLFIFSIVKEIFSYQWIIYNENRFLKKNMYFLATNLVSTLLKGGVKKLADLARMSGMSEKDIEEFLEKLIKQGFVKKDDSGYSWIKNVKRKE